MLCEPRHLFYTFGHPCFSHPSVLALFFVSSHLAQNKFSGSTRLVKSLSPVRSTPDPYPHSNGGQILGTHWSCPSIPLQMYQLFPSKSPLIIIHQVSLFLSSLHHTSQKHKIPDKKVGLVQLIGSAVALGFRRRWLISRWGENLSSFIFELRSHDCRLTLS